MARPRLIHEDTPAWLKWLLVPYQFFSSLGLAVVLIISMASTLALGTFVEAAYGTPVAQFFVYQTWWFNLGMILLAVNIFCAAAIRYPWKRHQTGFVITHIGLLTLIAGAALGRVWGIDAQLPVYEFQTERWAFEEEAHIDLTIRTKADGKTGEAAKLVKVPFHPGSFSWQDYKWINPLAPKSYVNLIFNIAGRHAAGDVLYNRDGVKLEVLDYYGDSREVVAPSVKLKLSAPPQQQRDERGRMVAGRTVWQPVELSVNPLENSTQYPYGIPDSQRVGGGAMLLSLSGSKEQTQAFLLGGPQGSLGEKGQVVLHAGGKATRFRVEDKLGKGRFKLTGSDIEAEVTNYWNRVELGRDPSNGGLSFTGDETENRPLSPTVKIKLYRGGKPLSELMLFAVSPELNVYDYKNKVFGDYWYNHSGLTFQELQELGVTSRIEVLQGENQDRLYYRYWNREKLVDADEFPKPYGLRGAAVNAFKMPIAQLKMYVEEHVAADKPMLKSMPKPFNSQTPAGQKRPAAQFRLTVDGKPHEFWLKTYMGAPDEPPRGRGFEQMAEGKNHVVTMTMPINAHDVGYRIYLQDFQRRLDSGTSQASHYHSTIDFLDEKIDRTLAAANLPSGEAAAVSLTAEQVQDAGGVAVDEKRGFLYWTDARLLKIMRMELASGDVQPVIEKHLEQPGAIAVDPKSGHLYWADVAPFGDQLAPIVCGADQHGEPLTLPPAAEPVRAALNRRQHFPAIAVADTLFKGIALDSEHGKLYFAAGTTIGRVNVDGSQLEEKIIDELGSLAGIAVDSENERIYWSEPESQQLRSAPLDDPSDGSILTSRGTDRAPQGIAVDTKNGKLYWAELDASPRRTEPGSEKPLPKHHTIMAADLDGRNAHEPFAGKIDTPGEIAVGHSAVYWTERATQDRDVWITMNAPVEFSDPKSGKLYRLFQESFIGPMKPGDAEFEQHMPADRGDEELYMSVLTVNYDPGRGVRNIGCLLVVLGISVMFYMRAYFFTPKKTAAAAAHSKKESVPAEVNS